jgi:histone-lysine N-methyltransferase SETMAR
MDKIAYCVVINFFVKEGLTPNEIYSKFIKVYGDSSPYFSTIKKRAAKFKRGRTSLEDDPYEGRLKKCATTPEIIKQVHDMILGDRRMKVRKIAETIGISKESVRYILHEELDMKKLCARWVSRLLTANQKRTRMKIFEQCLERFNKNKTDLLLWIILGFTITHQNPNSSKNSGQKPVVQRQKRQGRFYQQEMLWHRCFQMLKALYLLIILKRVKQ